MIMNLGVLVLELHYLLKIYLNIKHKFLVYNIKNQDFFLNIVLSIS